MNYTPNEIAELLKDKPQHPHYIAAMVYVREIADMRPNAQSKPPAESGSA